MEYDIRVGLEVHCELNTKSKMFCSCKNSFGDAPNTNCCPICVGMPGTLPSLNKEAVKKAIKTGLALNCKINQKTFSDRKNYFYPDLPKAYQISQFFTPICENGYLDIFDGKDIKRIRIKEIHFEEDAGKLIHDIYDDVTLIDYNRCGVPLIEIVTMPDIENKEQAKEFLESLKLLLQYIDVSDCKMEQGALRCDVNVSICPKGSKTLGNRCELKNINSFSAALKAIEYESKRQEKELLQGNTIKVQTRKWDNVSGKSILLREKEQASDYRFFKEPDIPIISITDSDIQKTKEEIPILPFERMKKYIQEYNLPYDDALVIVKDKNKSDFFDDCTKLSKRYKDLSNKIINDFVDISPVEFCRVLEFVNEGKLSNSFVKKVLEEIKDKNISAEKAVENLGLNQINDIDYISNTIKQVLSENQKALEDFKNGKKNAIGFLIGQCMKKSSGKANPEIVKKMIFKIISEDDKEC